MNEIKRLDLIPPFIAINLICNYCKSVNPKTDEEQLQERVVKSGTFSLLRQGTHQENIEYEQKWGDLRFFQSTIRGFQPLFGAKKEVTLSLWKTCWAIYYYTKVLEERDNINEETQMDVALKLLEQVVKNPDFSELPVIKFLNDTYIFGMSNVKKVSILNFLSLLEASLGYPNWLVNAKRLLVKTLSLEIEEDFDYEGGGFLEELTPIEQELLVFVIMANMAVAEEVSSRVYKEFQWRFNVLNGDSGIISKIEADMQRFGAPVGV